MKRLLLLASLFLVLTAPACKSGPEATPDGPDTTPEREVVAVDRGLTLAFADNPALVFKVRLDQVDKIAPALQKLTEQAQGSEKQMLEALVANRWTELFSTVTGKDAPATLGIDESAPVYVSVGTVGGDRFAEAFEYGAPLQPDEALPSALRIRVIVAASDPRAAEAAFEDTRVLGTRESYSLSVSREDDYVVADYERLRPGLDARMKLAAKSEMPRQTPAFEEFTASTDPLAVYMQAREVLAYGAAVNQYDMSRALESVSPANSMRVLAVSTMIGLNLNSLSPPSQRELEDTCIRLTGDGEKMAMVTGLSTQTELGRALAAANQEAAVLPSAFGAGAEPFAELRVNFDGDAMGHAASLPASESRRGVGSMNGLASAVRDSGWVGFAAVLAGSPTYVPRLMYRQAQETERAAMPYAMMLELMSPPQSDVTPAMRGGGPFPIYGVALAFAAAELSEAQVDSARHLLEVFPTSGGPKTSSTATDYGTLLRATNADSLAEDAEDVELEAGRLWGRLDLATMLELMGNSDLAQGLAPFDSLTADLSLRGTTNRWRLVAGDPGLIAEKLPEMDVEPLSVAPECVGAALSKRQMLFGGFESSRKGKMGPEEWLALLDKSGVDPAMTSCGEASPEHADSLQVARARMAEFMVRYAQLLEKPDVVEAIRKRGCELGDELQCAGDTE